MTAQDKFSGWVQRQFGSGALSALQPLDDTLTALAAITTDTDTLIYATGADTFATTTFTAFARTMLDDADAAAVRTTLGLGTLATQSGTFSGTSSGTNTGDQTTISGNAATATELQTARAINGVNFDGTAAITVTAAAGTLTGATLASNVLASSLTSVGTIATGVWNGTQIATAYIADNAVTLAKMDTMATASLLGRNTAGTGNVEVLSASTARTVLGLGTADSPTLTGLTLSGITAGSVLFGGTSGVIQQDNTNLFFDDTNNRLGVGTVSPTVRLTVVGPDNTAATNYLAVMANNLSEGVLIGYENIRQSGTNSALSVDANGTGKLLLQTVSTGKCGIGALFPLTKLQVQASDSTTSLGNSIAAVKIVNSQNATNDLSELQFHGYSNNSTNDYVIAAVSGLLTSTAGNTQGALLFSTKPNTASTSLTEAMRITAAGLVGIGVTPTAQLHVVNSTAGNISTIIKGAASQTADLTQWQNSSGTVLAKVDSAGVMTAQSFVPTSSTIPTYGMYKSGSNEFSIAAGSAQVAWFSNDLSANFQGVLKSVGAGLFNGAVAVTGFGAVSKGGFHTTVSGSPGTAPSVSLAASQSDYGNVGYNIAGTSAGTVLNYVVSDAASFIKFAGSDMKFYTAASGTAGNPITQTVKMKLDVGGALTLTPSARTSGVLSYLSVTTPADTGLTASTESIGVNFATGTRQWSTGALTTQRERVIAAPTYAFVGASTITTAATFAITAAPIAGTNATITNAYALWVQAGRTQLDGIVALGSTLRLKGYTVAGLPAGVQGDTAFCTDLLTPTFLVTAVGGGAVVGPVFYNGTNWVSY